MMYLLHIRPAVYKELEEVQDWYEQKQPGLGDRFEDCIKTTLDRILQVPFVPPIVRGNVRRIEMKTFPYTLFYYVNGNKINVIRLLHKRRNPDHWPRSNTN